jgi:hypothetical protein
MNEFSSQSIEIRRARQDNAAAIRELTRSAYAKWVPLIGREPTSMSADYDGAVREHMIDLLFVDAELTALIETVSRPDHLLIANVAVSPTFQGRSYGAFYWTMRSILRDCLGCRSSDSTRTNSLLRTSRSIAGAATRSTVKNRSGAASSCT